MTYPFSTHNPTPQFVPCFGAVASFIGALFSMLVSAVFPAVFHLKVANGASVTAKVVDVAIVIVGLGCIVFGTVSALKEMVSCVRDGDGS